MTDNELNQIRHIVKENAPLIHCITNPISIHQCANLALAVGARPIMAEHPKEVREITATAEALLLNLGNITDARMESMMISAEEAQEKGIPVVLDLVGIACSRLRRSFACQLLQNRDSSLRTGNVSNKNPSFLQEEGVSKKKLTFVLKGNYSEINALYNLSYESRGVDAEASLDLPAISDIAAKLSEKYGCTILASGKTDIVTDGKTLVHVKNGSHKLATVTGTGCMLGTLTACYLSACHSAAYSGASLAAGACRNTSAAAEICRDISAAVAACAVLGICGELSETEKGAGSFMVNLMDNLSTLSDTDLKTHLNLQIKNL
ncbi:MAG: hydroxyethylthiazole kinase [Roseburia sp.]|nr:hydroxyethylthiazole kinase [Roseburia sp.]